MSDVIIELFGQDKNLDVSHMILRSILVFFFTLFLIRLAGRRSFSLRAPLDNIIVILLGAVTSRAIAGASPFIPTLCAALTIAALHRISALLGMYSSLFSRVAKGKRIVLYDNGEFLKQNMRYSLVSEEDLRERVRLHTQRESFDHVETISIERCGEISIITKANDSKNLNYDMVFKSAS